MFNRRQFLGTLFASVVGTVFAPQPLLWMPSPDLALPPVAPEALLTLDAITREVARQLANKAPRVVARGEARVGEGALRRQLGIDLMLPAALSETGLDADRYIRPAVAALAARIDAEGWERFGELALPLVGCEASRCTSSTVSVRGVIFYEPSEDLSYLRMDVLGG